LRLWNEAMATRAEADDFVIYKHEWYMGGVVPGPYGVYHLGTIARRLDRVPFPVIIQPVGIAEIDKARVRVVVDYLTQHGIKDAEQGVCPAYPEEEGRRFNDPPQCEKPAGAPCATPTCEGGYRR